MKLNIIQKITIWTLSFFIVVSSLFLQVKIDFSHICQSNAKIQYTHTIDSEPMFKLIDVVTIDVSNVTFQRVEAKNVITQVLFDLVVSIWLSIGANDTYEVLEAGAMGFWNWYQDWYNNQPTLGAGSTEEEIAAWLKAQQIPDYLEATGQLNNDGTLKNPSNIVLEDDYIKSLYFTSQYYMNDYLDRGGVKWYAYGFNNQTHMLPNIAGVDPYVSSILAGKEGTLKIQNTNYHLINMANFDYEIQEQDLGYGVYRLKVTLDGSKSGNPTVVRYTADLTQQQVDIMAQAVAYILVAESYSGGGYSRFYLRVIPLFWNLDLPYTMDTYSLPLRKSSLTTSSDSYISWSNDYSIIMSQPIGKTPYQIYLTDGFPDSYEGDEGNYYNIPIYDGSDTPPVITPVPVEDEGQYIYNPPTPGVGSPEWSDLVNPSTPAPTATAENTLNGGIFQALGDWFVSVLYGAFNAMMGFFKALGANLISMLQSLIDTWKSLIPDNWYDDFWDNFLTNMISLFIPTDLDSKFNTLLTYFEDKFGLLFYGIEVLVSFFNRVVNTTPRDSIQLFAFSIDGIQIIPNYEFNFTEFASQNEFLLFIYQAMKSILTALFILGFFYGVYSKYESMRDH